MNATNSCSMDFSEAELPVILICTLVLGGLGLFTLLRAGQRTSMVDFTLMSSLAINDFLTALIFFLMWLVTGITSGKLTGYWCSMLGWMGSTMLIWAFYIVTVMSACRSLAVTKPQYYRTKVKVSSIRLGLTGTWLISAAQTILPLFDVDAPFFFYEDNCVCGYNFAPGIHSVFHRVMVAAIATQGMVGIVLTVFFNGYTVLTMRKKGSMIPQQLTARRKSIHQKSQYIQRSLVRVTLITSAILCLCYGPFIVRILYDVVENTPHQNSPRHDITSSLLFLSPLLNPFVYVGLNKYNRAYFIRMCAYVCSSSKWRERLKGRGNRVEVSTPEWNSRNKPLFVISKQQAEIGY